MKDIVLGAAWIEFLVSELTTFKALILRPATEIWYVELYLQFEAIYDIIVIHISDKDLNNFHFVQTELQYVDFGQLKRKSIKI